jgi:hypothetical protein
MKLLYGRCAGLDVHQKSISVCVRIRPSGQPVEIQEAVFGTFTRDLERLRDWLKQHKVKQVAMESTGVYWIPVWNILEPVSWGFELLLVNPQTVRALRGRKTDRIDARRIAEYLQYGLLHGSFVPSRPIRQLRDLTRMRVRLQGDRNRVINRIGRLLETVNIKLKSVASKLTCQTAQAILKAIARGKTQPEDLASLALGKLKAKKTALALALEGRYNDHFRWLLGQTAARLGEAGWKAGGTRQSPRPTDGAARRLSRAVGQHSGGGPIDGVGADCGVRSGDEPVSHRETRGQLGGAMSWQCGERGEAIFGQDTEGRPVFATHSGAERVGGIAYEGLLPHGGVLSHCSQLWPQESGGGGGTPHPGDGLSPHAGRHRVPGTGRRLFRPRGCGTYGVSTEPAAATDWL